MFIDSHCHLTFPELAADLDGVLARMRENAVTHALCVCVTLEDYPQVRALAERYPHIFGSVGVHPDYEDVPAVDPAELARLTDHPKIIAIGETGLDYYRLKGDLEWQRDRFRNHVRAARLCGKPLIIHCREAAADTLRILREEGADAVGGVMHCFTESWEVAQGAMELGFYISFSGIVTFKNAQALKAVAVKVPLDRLMIETDSPYLAPVPHRGKVNEPGLVRHVAAEIARLRDLPLDQVGAASHDNFKKLFNVLRNESHAPH
jgi:TatD DNase family protein